VDETDSGLTIDRPSCRLLNFILRSAGQNALSLLRTSDLSKRQSDSVLTKLLAASIGYQIIVLETHSALTLNVTAGLQGDHVSFDQNVFAF
jgi:hypothetical protein